MNLNNIKKLSGDASFRNFYRTKSSIIVFCKRNKKSNLLAYDAINKILLKNDILAPRLLSQNYKKNYIEIEDFGDMTVFKKFKIKNINKYYYYKKILSLLKKTQKIKTHKTKTFLKNDYKILDYSNNKLINESNLFIKWYLPKYIRGKKKNIIKKKSIKFLKN